MRIRKRSITALSLSCEKPEISCSSHQEEQMIEEKQFLLPLVAAAMDVQAKTSAAHGFYEEREGHAIAQIRSRPLHKWRNELLRFTLESQESGESDKSSYMIWNGNTSCRKTEEDKIRMLTSEGKSEMKGLNLGLCDAMKKQRNKSNCTKKYPVDRKGKSGGKKKGNDDEEGEEKKMEGGSQCRRRNGRGWRCSERTLVGYYLCEHHLGKGRLKSINNSAPSVLVGNAKAAKFKDLKLIHAAAPPSTL